MDAHAPSSSPSSQLGGLGDAPPTVFASVSNGTTHVNVDLPAAEDGRSHVQEPLQFMDDEEAHRLLRTGTFEEALRAMRVDCRGYHNRVFIVMSLFIIGIAFTIMGSIFARAGIETVTLTVGMIIFLSAVVLTFFLLPPDNPIKNGLRRFATACCCNNRFRAGLVVDSFGFAHKMCGVVSFMATLAAIILSSIVINDPNMRHHKPLIRATVAMWVLAFVTCFPCGGGRRIQDWLRRIDDS